MSAVKQPGVPSSEVLLIRECLQLHVLITGRGSQRFLPCWHCAGCVAPARGQEWITRAAQPALPAQARYMTARPPAQPHPITYQSPSHPIAISIPIPFHPVSMSIPSRCISISIPPHPVLRMVCGAVLRDTTHVAVTATRSLSTCLIPSRWSCFSKGVFQALTPLCCCHSDILFPYRLT